MVPPRQAVPRRAALGFSVLGDRETPTLYEWAGGEAAFRGLIDAFYDRAEKDELIAPYFPGGVHEAHRAHVAAWWREVFGGPAEYTEELGGYDHMVARHRGRGTGALRVADEPHVEWGTRLALENSQPGADVVEHAAVPRWGWGEAPPYQG